MPKRPSTPRGFLPTAPPLAGPSWASRSASRPAVAGAETKRPAAQQATVGPAPVSCHGRVAVHRRCQQRWWPWMPARPAAWRTFGPSSCNRSTRRAPRPAPAAPTPCPPRPHWPGTTACSRPRRAIRATWRSTTTSRTPAWTDARFRAASPTTGYAWSFAGENIAAGQPTVSSVMSGWLASPGHCANIMKAEFRDVAVSCVSQAGSSYGRYWTMSLARPL